MANDGSENPALPHLSCPNCGAGFDWHARFSQLVVCESCDSAIVVDKEAVKIAGKMSALAQTPGPFWVGATGKIGRRRFHVLGRVRYGYEGGYWDEWYLAEPDGRTFWIGEDENEFTITHLSEREMPPSFWERAQPGARLSYGEHSYLVQERDEAVCEGGEGQLPFVVVSGERFEYAELVAPGGQFITVERDEGTDRVFKGGHLDVGQVKLDMQKPGDSAPAGFSQQQEGRQRRTVEQGRDQSLSCFACGGALDISKARGGNLTCPYCSTVNDLEADKLQCPDCGEGMALPGGDAVGFVVCPCCKAEVDTSGAEPALIGKSASTVLTGGASTFKVGERCKLEGEECVITGHLRLSTSDSWGTYYGDEYLLYGRKSGYRWLSEEDGHFNLVVQLKDPPPEMSRYGQAKTKWDGETWTHFETDEEKVEWVNGQLPYVARAGDTHAYTDWVAPPKKLTEETTGREREYFMATYLSQEEVAEAFGRDNSALPLANGVGANQPYSVSAWRRAMTPFLAIFLLINLGLFAWASYSSGHPRAIVPITKLELKADVTSEPVKFHSRMIEVDFRSEPFRTLSYGYATVTVLNEADKAVADFSVQWKTKEKVLFRLPASGTYRLKVNAQTSPEIGVKATFREGVVLGRYFLLLSLIFGAWLVIEWLSKRSFEQRRFADVNDDSGFGFGGYDDDDDDDWDD
jgi:hypothetical protein